jgi:hypothetical protein
MSGAISTLPQYTSMAWCSVKKHRDNFTIILYIILYYIILYYRSVTALVYGLDDWGFESQQGQGIVFPHHRVQDGSGAHPLPIQWVPGSLSLGVKWPGCEADYSPLSSAEVKNE